MGMRTTVTLDADVAALIERDMAKRGVSFKQALNDAIRSGLIPEQRGSAAEMPTFRMGRPTVSLDKALRLTGELEDDAVIAKLELRK